MNKYFIFCRHYLYKHRFTFNETTRSINIGQKKVLSKLAKLNRIAYIAKRIEKKHRNDKKSIQKSLKQIVELSDKKNVMGRH